MKISKNKLMNQFKKMEYLPSEVNQYTKPNQLIERQIYLSISNGSDDFDTTIEHYIEVF